MYQKAPKPRYNSLAAALLLTALYMFQPNATMAQVGIGTETPHSSAILDLVSDNKGLLISRVALDNLEISDPVKEPVDGMLVWNTNDRLGIGFYYWHEEGDRSRWYSLFTRLEYDQQPASGITSDNIASWNTAYSHSTTTTGNVHGSTTVGSNIYRLTNPNAIRYLRINANNSVTALNAADFRSDIGAGTSDLALGETTTTAYQGDRGKAAYDHAQLNSGSVHGSTTVGGSLFRLTNPSAVSFLRVNADNTVTARSAADFRSDIGAENLANKKTSLADNSDEFYPTQKAVKSALEEQNALLLAQITELQIIAGIKVKDADGNIYNTVTIGTQVWMKENLKTTKYNDGTDIPNVTDNATWAALTTPAFSWYANNQATYKDTYGALYNWYAVSSTTNGDKNICPQGWHVPTDDEWTQLIDYVVAQGYPNTDVVGGAGNALKSCRQVSSPEGGDCATSDHPRWNSSSIRYGIDVFGFAALPGGRRRYINGTFLNVGSNGNWWSSTQLDAMHAWPRGVNNSDGSIDRLNYVKRNGFSVRCVRDN
jgi:uncharacterized protein (TIGR02145 family)